MYGIIKELWCSKERQRHPASPQPRPGRPAPPPRRPARPRPPVLLLLLPGSPPPAHTRAGRILTVKTQRTTVVTPALRPKPGPTSLRPPATKAPGRGDGVHSPQVQWPLCTRTHRPGETTLGPPRHPQAQGPKRRLELLALGPAIVGSGAAHDSPPPVSLPSPPHVPAL